MLGLEKTSGKVLLVAIALSICAAGCSKSGDEAPPAPAMPEVWKVKVDKTLDHNEREFLETEGRLVGRIKALRVTIYEINGRNVKLHTIVPRSSEEADKMFRALAHRKQPWSYLRKDEIIYEFVGPGEAEQDIVKARELLMH